MTQPLLYRYFPSKDDLIKEVYRTVYLEPFDHRLGQAAGRPLAAVTRPAAGILSRYTDVIFTRKWLRIYLYSGLKGLDINRWYVGVVRDKILTRIMRECRHELGFRRKASRPHPRSNWPGYFTAASSITAFANTSTNLPVLEDKEQMISDALDVFLAGFERVFGRARPVSMRPPVKAVG